MHEPATCSTKKFGTEQTRRCYHEINWSCLASQSLSVKNFMNLVYAIIADMKTSVSFHDYIGGVTKEQVVPQPESESKPEPVDESVLVEQREANYPDRPKLRRKESSVRRADGTWSEKQPSWLRIKEIEAQRRKILKRVSAKDFLRETVLV